MLRIEIEALQDESFDVSLLGFEDEKPWRKGVIERKHVCKRTLAAQCYYMPVLPSQP
jgi:hypothetical protein